MHNSSPHELLIDTVHALLNFPSFHSWICVEDAFISSQSPLLASIFCWASVTKVRSSRCPKRQNKTTTEMKPFE